MPQQLIYTSAPRGLVAGRSGYCTVARSTSMREPVMLQLERFSYYQHLSLSGGRERPIFTCRIVDIRGSRFHVLSRIQDAGLDFTGRTNFIAHHLVFTPEEIRQHATPPVILRDWTGWITSWSKEPQMLENENWPELAALVTRTNVPAQTWQRVTGDAVNGYGPLEARAGASFRADDLTDEDVLSLLTESLELLEVRDVRREFRASSWNYTFTTSIQEQDNPADFRWRCFHSDNPAANRFAAPDCRPLSAVRAMKWTDEEIAFARTGRQKPQVIVEPQEIPIAEGETARFTAHAKGVPSPTYQWFSLVRDNNGHDFNGHVLPGESNSELILSNPVLGTSRYVVRVSNSAGHAQSNMAILTVNPKVKMATRTAEDSRGPVKPALYNVKTADDIERDRDRHRIKREQEALRKRLLRNRILAVTGTIAFILVISGFLLKNKHSWPFKPNAKLVARAPNTASTNRPTSAQLGSTSQAELDGNPPPTDYPLPMGWTAIFIGNNVVNTTAEFHPEEKSRFDLSATVDASVTNGDNIFFVYTNTGKEFRATLKSLSDSSLGGIMLRESEKSNTPFLFVGRSSTNVVVYLSGSNQQPFESVPIRQQNLSNSLTLAFKPITNQWVPFYGFGTNDLQPFNNAAISGGQRLIGFALASTTSSSNRVSAHFFDELPRE